MRRAAVAALLALPACTIDLPKPELGQLDGCREVRLVVAPVDGQTRETVSLRARLTFDNGQPVVGQTIRFALVENDDEGIIWSWSGRTGDSGDAEVPLAQFVADFRNAQDAYARARFTQAEYVNPAHTGGMPAPGWCSAKERVPFAPVR